MPLDKPHPGICAHAIRLLLVGLFFIFGNLSLASEAPLPFSAVYEVHHSGARVGLTTIKLSADDNGEYSMSTVTQPKGLAAFVRSSPVEERSQFRWTPEGHQQSLHYTFLDGSRKGKRNSKIDFDWVRSVAASSYKNRTVDINLTSPIGDRLALQAQVMRDLIADDLQSEYQVIDRNEIKTYLFRMIDEEVLDTHAGRFHTVKIEQKREGSSRKTHIWASPEHGFATVKVTQFKDNKPRTVLMIKSIERAEPIPQDSEGQVEVMPAEPSPVEPSNVP